MLKFKEFLTEDISSKDLKIKKLESLPLHHGHEGTEIAANMLDGIYNKLLGKPSKVKTEVQTPGLPVNFGYDSKNGNFVIQHNDKKNHSLDDIENNYDDENIKRKLKLAATHLPKITPKEKGMYMGKIVDMPEYDTPLNMMITHDNKGNRLKNSQKAKFGDNPNISIINSEIRTNPSLFKPDDIKKYKEHMKAANKSYGKIDPEVWDYISNGHHKQIERYVNENDTPNLEGYVDYLTQIYGDKNNRAKQKNNEIKAKTSMNRYDDLMTHISNNEKHYSNVIEFMSHLKNAKNILGNIIKANGNKHHVIVSHGDNEALLKIPS